MKMWSNVLVQVLSSLCSWFLCFGFRRSIAVCLSPDFSLMPDRFKINYFTTTITASVSRLSMTLEPV